MRATFSGIEQRIRGIERAEYDLFKAPNFPEKQLSEQIRFFRITDLARFWDDPQSCGESLQDRQERLITSLYGTGIFWIYLIIGENATASVFIGLPCNEANGKTWEQLLAAQLPGSCWQMDLNPRQILSKLISFPLVANLSGNPSIDGSVDQSSATRRASPGLESLFETMSGFRWAYMVAARPLSEQETAADLRKYENELLEVNSSHRRHGSTEEKNNPLVSRYVALLESAHKKSLQGQKQGMWDVQSYFLADHEVASQRGAQALHAAFGGAASEPQPFRIKTGSRTGLKEIGIPMATRLNTSEVVVLTSLPRREVAGLQVADYVTFGLSCAVGSAGGVALGTLMSGSVCTSSWFEVPKDSFNKHVFIAGVPGSGKTRTCMFILFQLWKEQGIPWLVLEPSMKSEYRALLQSTLGADLRVLTAGDESIAPLRLNPLEVPKGIHLQTHIGGLATLFKAAFAMEAPLPYVLDKAIYRVYEDRGWDLVTGDHPSRDIECQPTIGDLLETCTRVVQELKYDAQLKGNIHAALETRLSSLMRGAKGRMLNVRQSVPMEYLLSAPTVIECSAIGDDDEKAFLLGCILLKLAQQRQIEGLSTKGLKHVTLIEEAHRLLRNVSETTGTTVANPRHQAVEAFSNMLAELRAYGEGLVVVDQMPSKLVPDVIRNSGLKIIHRLTAEEERVLVGGAMALNEAQTRFLSGLSSGQAIVYSDGNINACRIKIPDHAGREGYLREYPSNAQIKSHMQGLLPPTLNCQNSEVPAKTEISDTAACQHMKTCPSGICSTRRIAGDYVRQHAVETENEFRKAKSTGFEALWLFGERMAKATWRDGAIGSSLPFCAVMAFAEVTAMEDKDVRVLRQNMAQLWDVRRKGGLS
jgi:hypothetical protein